MIDSTSFHPVEVRASRPPRLFEKNWPAALGSLADTVKRAIMS
jgi:hypothetical protein